MSTRSAATPPRARRRWWIAGLAVAAVVAPSAPAQADVQRGIVYGHGRVTAPAPGAAPLRLDLYLPAAPAAVPRPVAVLIHGGGFMRRSRTDPNSVRIARALAAQGIAAASIDYRLSGSGPRPSPRVAPLLAGLPPSPVRRATVAAVDDTLTAIDYLRRHARRLGLDPRRVGLIGSSAGAMTAAHVAYTLDDYGIPKPAIRFVGDLWGGIVIAAPDGRRAAQLSAGDPPLFAVHGSADQAVPVRLSDRLVGRARDQGVPVEYHRVPGGGHGFAGSRFFTWGQPTPFARLVRFARAWLQP